MTAPTTPADTTPADTQATTSHAPGDSPEASAGASTPAAGEIEAAAAVGIVSVAAVIADAGRRIQQALDEAMDVLRRTVRIVLPYADHCDEERFAWHGNGWTIEVTGTTVQVEGWHGQDLSAFASALLAAHHIVEIAKKAADNDEATPHPAEGTQA